MLRVFTTNPRVRRVKLPLSLGALCLCLLGAVPQPWAAPGLALAGRSLVAVRVATPPRIDGDLSDDCWRLAAKAESFTDIYLGLPPADLTEAWVCYDATNIYAAFRCYEAQPDKVAAQETKPEAGLRGDDAVCLNLDAFHTHRSTDRCLFVVNARGAHVADIGVGRAVKTEWKGEWQSAGRVGTNAWTVEMAIPWAMLSYPTGQRPVTMGLNFSRMQQRTKVVSFWSFMGTIANYKLDGHWEGVTPGPFKPRFRFLPYALAQAGPTTRATAGLDVRAALTPSVTGVLTINPDFGTVERAVEGIDFSYSERFVPDRRPFFMEGERFYSENTLVGQFFYSQRVPDFDAGLNTFGRVARGTSLGLLGAFEASGREDYVVRARQEFNATDSVAVSAIGRTSPGSDNEVLVVQPVWRRGNWICLTHWAPSWEEGRYRGDALNLDFSYVGSRVSFGNIFHYVHPEFRADNGYIPFTDLRGNYTWLSHTTEWRAGPVRLLRVIPMFREEQHYDDRWSRLQPAGQVSVETRGDWGLDLRWQGGSFEQFDDHLLGIALRGRVSDKFHNYGVGFQFGRQGGDDLSFLTPSFNWRFGERLSVGLASSFLWHLQDRQQHILSVNYDLSRAWSVGGRVVSQTGRTSGFVSLRRSGYSGVDFYLIFGRPDPAVAFDPMVTVKVVVPL